LFATSSNIPTFQHSIFSKIEVKNMIIDYNKVDRVYFVGIGGIGMSALARYFAKQGKIVCGYDRTQTLLTLELESEGIDIHYVDDIALIPREYRNNIQGTLVVYTPAVPKNHSELEFFENKGFTIVKRAEALGVIASAKKTLAVAGTHGKTTTSTLLAHLLTSSKVGCDAFLGGISKNFSSNLVINPKGSENLVVEADEFDRSFLSLYPDLAIITSVDADHLDIYDTHEDVLFAYEAFASQIKHGGTLIIKHGIGLVPLLSVSVKVYYYSLRERVDYYLTDIEIKDGFYHFSLVTPKGTINDLVLGVPGLYNVENAVAASAAALQQGVSEDELRKGLSTFTGVVRRFDVQYRGKKAVYIDDYAHHPEELRAAIISVMEMYPDRRVAGIFQPHLFTRTRDFMREFAESLDILDKVYLLDIYPARELPIPGITSNSILKLMECPNKGIYTKEELISALKTDDIDILVTMGAGDIDKLVPEIVEILTSREL
jgi:UDP-N-acetylmuramate--alanine ligase